MPDTDRRNHHDIGYGEDFYRALDPHYRAPAALPEAKSNNDAGYGEDFYRTLDPDAPATQKSPAVKTPLQNAPEQRGFFKEAASALASGAVSTAEALTSTAEMIGVPGAERASSYLRGVQESEALVRPDYLRSGTVLDEPARLADWRWWTRTVGENIPNALAMLVPAGAVSKLGQIGKLGTLLKGSATARRAAALGAGFSASFPLEAGSAYSSAKQEMSATGQYDADTIERIATAEGLVAGTTNAIIELLPIDSLLFKQSGGDRLLRRILRQAYIEGGTETVQEAVNILVEQYGHAPDATLKDQIGRVIEAGLAGGVIGGGFGATIGTAEHRAKTNAYSAIAHKTDLDEDIVRWKQEDLPDKNIAELVSARLDDYRRSAAPDATTQIPAKIDAAEMVSFVLYGSGRFQPDRSGAKKKAAVLRAMGMKPKTPPAEMPMTTSAADGKAVITEEQRAQAQNERAAANRKAQGKTLFDAVASEDLAETQAIEQARQDDEARRNEETVRLAAAEQASRDKAVADAQSRQDALIARLAGADPQKQALVQDVLGLSERALLSAVQKELKLTVTPAGPGAYTVETPGGPQPADLFDLRQRLAEKRSADFTARQDEEAANAAAVRRMEEEQARKKREREAAAALDMSRRSLVASLSGPTPEQLAHLNANRQRLTPDEIARLDRWMKKDRDSAPVSPPPAPRPSAVISEEVNAAAKAAPPKQDNGQDDETALVDLMLSDVANARKGGELRTDDAGETIRDTAGIAWLTAANRAGADVTVKDAKTVLNKVKTGEDLTERQQRQLTAILDAMRAAGGAKVTQALSWAKKGYIPVDNRRIAVRDMVEGDSYVIDNEEFRVTDIDDAGNVTLKDGTIKKVRDGEMLTGVDFVKPVEGAEDFSGESFDDAMKRVESEAEPPQAPPVPESRKTPPASVAVTTGLKTKAPEKRDISQLAGDLAAGRIAPGKFTFPADVTPQEINEVWDDLSAAVENIAKKNEPFIRALHEEIDALGPARTAAIKAQKKALLDKIRALQDEADALDRKITNAFEGAQAQLLDTIIERAKAEGLFIDDAESEEVYELYSTLQEGRSHDPLFIDGKIPEDYVNTWTVPLAEQILDELRAQQPTGDAYPVPNSSGVYNEKQKKAEVISFPQNKAFDAAVYVLQVGPEEWISAEDVSLKTGSYAGQSSPLTKNPVFPTRKAALADALKTVQQFGDRNARDASSVATDKSRKAAAQIAQWAEKQYLELYPPSQAPSQAVAVTTGLKPKKAAALPPEMPIIRARLQHLKSLGVNTAGYDEWVKVMESGDAAALANEPPAQDTLRAINLTIAEEEKILKAQAQEKGFGAGNTLFTEDKAAKARAILKAKLSGAQLNAGIDPEILTAGIDLAGYYIEGGVRKFADFTAKMVEDIGEQIRPYLKSLYLAVRNYPGFDNAGMETEADIEKSLTAAAATDKIAAKGEKSHADSSDLDAGAAGNAPAAAASARQEEQNAGRLPEDVRAVVSGIEGQARREGSDVPQGVNLPAEIQAHAEQYLYHATYAEKIAGINAAGLDPTKSNQYIYGNDTTKRVYLSPDQELSLAFGDVLLRVRRSALNQKLLKEIARQGGQEVWYFDRIAPSLIERFTPRGEWVALSAQTEKIPQSVAVTTGAKTPKTKESAYMAAVGLISGGRADRARVRGYEFAYGPADAATKSEMVGLFSGLAADKLLAAGITIQRTGPPAAFKIGDRVAMKNGRHGKIIADESYTMTTATIFGGQREVKRYENYRVRTDAGAEFGMIKPEDLTKETEKPAEPVVPDIREPNGIFEPPDKVLYHITLARSDERKYRAQAQRMRKRSNIDSTLRDAELQKKKADELQRLYDDWAAKYPAEAAKYAPAKTPPPASVSATTGIPAAVPSPQPSTLKGTSPVKREGETTLAAYGLTVTKGSTNTGKTVWNVSGTETRTWKDYIKQAGGRWYGPKKVWSFYNGDPAAALLQTLPPIDQVHPSIREKYAAKPTAAAAKAYPDLTVSGQPQPVPDHPDASYVVHIRKPDLIPDTFRVVVSAQRAAGGGFLTQAGTGMTPEQAYDNALANYDRTIETRRSSTNQDAESVTNTTTPIDNEKTNDYNKIEQEAQDAPSDRHDTDETSSEDDRAGAQGPGTRDVSATSDERSTSGVSQGTRRADDEHVRGPVRGTLQGSIRHESDLSGTSPAPDFRTQPGVGRNNGDVADVQRSATGERTDHVITPGAIDRTGSWFQTAQTNLDIIELAKKIQTENRPATPTEQALLARYTGFGASEIANRMFPGWAEAGEIQLWRADQKWKPLVERMQKLFSPAEIATAARSTQYAHYTSPAIIDSIYKALDGFGFPGGRVLEPGMGVGSFFGLMPESMRTTTKYTGIEMDGITAQIAKLLYPRQNIIEGDYTKAQFPNNYFDLAIGNPPYAKTMILADPDYKKLRLSLHDFFFVKSLDKIRPGGLMVFITSRYTMDKVDSRVRKILNEKSDLLGAVRLPQTAFAKNAGTEVVTDVIFLRKKVPGEKSAGMMWGEVAPVTTPEGDFRINEYYLAHPEMVLGDHSGRGKMQNSRDPQYTVLPREGNIEEAFAQAVTHLPKAVYSLIKAAPAVQEAAAIERDFNPQNKKEGGLYLSPNGQVMVTESGAGVPITAIAPKLSDKDRRWLTSYITLRDAVKQCQYDQLTDGDWESSLKELNRVYKAFKMAWGRINAFTITERKSTDEDGKEITIHLRKFANSRLLRLDVESPLVMALEKVTEDFQIADGPFLSSRTIKKPEPPQISTVADALAVSLNEKGRLDLAHIASLMGASEADVFEQLGDLVYDTPDKGIQLADAYLSGNVVKKLEEAKAAAKIDPKYERNVQALIASLPKPLTAKDITPSPGATWIPLPVYNDFLHEVLELPESAAADHSPADNQWTISGLPVQSQRGRASAWSSPDRGANEIFSAVLNNATLKVYKTGKVAGVEKTYLDPAATAQVNDIAKKMKIRFRNWVWENAGRAHELLNIYNSTRNNIVPRRFDGSHLTLPGVSLRFKLMPHQKNAIWRIIQDGNTYIAHAVGAGKTYEMVAAGMEMKRLSLISKPLYVVPNHMLQQFANEFQELYPLAHVMVADEENFHTTNRRRFMAQAALNNPDAIVITHSAFGLLKMKQENILPVRNDVVSEMQAALDDLEGDKKANRIRIKQMEARIEQTEQRFESMIAQGDNVITFEDMGVDFLFVDEAHQFRKLDFTTNRQAKGIDPSGSVRAMMLYIKTQWLDRQNPGRSHVFASGTPITNTMGELYTVMKFFDMDGLRRDGLDYFDSWAAEYGDMNSAPEMNAAGRYEIVDRFSRFVNVPELMSRVRSFMDVLTSSQLGAFVKRPKVRGGQPTIVVTPASPALKNYQTNVLLPRIESSKNWKPSKEEPGNPDPLINIITDGRLASIDMRFVAPGSPNDPDSKLNKYIDKIIEHYKETAGHTYLDPATGQKSPVRGAAQICFYNHGFGRGVASSRGFDARAWAMRRFKEAGIPVDEIAWIDDFDTAAKKEAVMKEVRNGHKRILIGSAKKMGTGMNVQTRLSHMTYLDPPWYPSDVEQPVGRILRQGNQNEEVGIFYFSTKGSYDATMWQMVTRKAKFIEDALAGGGARAIEDISESSLYEMAAALASGDERAIRLAGLRNEIEGLENLRSAHYHTQTNLQREKRLYEIGHPGKKAYVAKLEAAMQKVPFDLRYLSAQHPIKAKLGHRDYTDRKAFAQDLLAKIVALRNAGTAGTTPIGHFFGLELRVVQAQGGNTEVWDRSGQTELIPGKVVNQLQLRITDDVIYDVASDITDTSDAPGLVTRLTNRAKAVPSDLAQAKQSLEETETELKKINARLGAPFELARELEEKIAEAAQIDADLVREGQATTAAQQQQHTAPAQTPDQTPPDTSGPMLSLEETPIFFSQMSRVLQAKLPGSGTPEQYRSAIVSWANKGGFKADELKWSGLTDWLVAQKGKLAKQQVLDYLAANEVQLREVHLSDTPSDPQLDRLKNAFAQAEEGVRAISQALGARPYMSGAPLRWMYRPDGEAPRNVPKQYFDTLDRWSEARLDLDDYQATHEGFFEEDEESTGRTQYSNQQLPGGKNYRELLLTLPEKKTVPTLKHSYRSAHWNTPNVLAHVRYNDRTDANGNRVLFLEEVQSDWHQEGRKKGYADDKITRTPPTRDEIAQEIYGARYADLDTVTQSAVDGELDARIHGTGGAAPATSGISYVPPAPFAKTWHELAMKRMLRYAAENGYDKVAWTTGEQQNERYDLSKHIGEIAWSTRPDGSKAAAVFLKTGQKMPQMTITDDGMVKSESQFNGKMLDEIIGQELARKVITSDRGALSGLDLKVGGEGMKGFYDTILPAFVNKYAKKWGAKVGTADIRTEALNRTPGAAKADTVSVHAIDVTPAMKESVLTGQPMFSRQDKTAHRRPHRLGDVELDEMVQQLAALLKGVEIVKHGNEIRLKTRSGEEVRIESAEQIDPSTIALAIKKHYSQDKKQTPQSGAGVAGMYSAGKITLVEDMAGIWTLSHEFYHFLEDIGAISNADKATLNRKIAYLITSQPETYGYLQGRSLPEQRADYVGRTLTGMYDATTPTGTILARIREVIDRILNALGIRTARGILRDIETGKIYKDQGERNKGQEKGKTPLLRQDIDNIRERAYTYGEGGKHETSVSDSGFDGEGSRQYPGRDAALRFQPTVVGREKKGSIPAAGRIVRTPHDAAKIAATYLNKYPDEHMISLVLDAKGKVISVYHHTIGLPGNSQASMPILAGEAMNTPGASSIIVAHNHPSQNAEFSPEDRAFARQLNNLLTGSGVTMRDFLAVAQKQYSSYSENMLVYVDDSVDINSARSGVKIPIVGRIFESVRSPLLKVSSAEDALPLAQQYIPDGGTLILDGQNALAGFSTIQNYGRIRGDAQRAILQDIEKRNGRAMIVYSPGRIVGTAESFNLGKFIAATGGQVRLLDIIDSSGSHADNGDMPAIPTADSSLFLSVAEDVTEKAADAVGRKVSRAVDLITGRVSPEKRETLSALRKSWAEFWRPFSTVTNGEEVLARRYESMGNVAKAVRFIETMKAELDQFPPETKKDIFWYLNGDIPLTVLPEDAQTFAKNIHRRTEIIGEMLVDRGLLTEETFEAHKGTYVHYLYAKHIVGEDAPVGITSSGKLDLSYTLRRNPDLTMQQRKELGLIDDASVAVPVGMGKALTDIAKFDYLETIAENPDWVWQPSVVRVAVGKKLKTPVMGRTRRYVMMGIGKLQEQVRTYDEMMRTRPTTEVAEIHKILTDAWQKEQAKTQNAPADFVQLPNTRGYGPLAGAFVKKPIADDLRPVMDVNTDRGKLLNTVLEIERQGMAAFKMGKVALNIPTACRNIVSNIIQNNMRGRALAKIPGDIVAACQSMKARDAHYEEAFGMGLFHTNWFVTEINDVLQEFRKIESGRIDQILSAVKNVAKYYGRIDDISKFAIFLQMRKAGAPIDKAAIEAMKWGMDYSLTSRSIKGLRQTIMPFATYQYKIAPLIAESLGKRPWVLAKFALIYPAAKLAAMALHDLDDDDWEDLEKQLPAYIKKSGSMMILPWKTDQDQWQWVNLEYYFPFGNMLAIFRDAKALDSGEALRDLGISNPFLSMFYTGLSAREDSPPLHAYSGIPIYNELDPGWMKAAKYLEYMANTWLPGMLTRQGALGYTGKAIAGGEDRWGREVSFGQALGRWFGFNIVSVSPEQSRAQVAVKIQDLHKEMARIEADPSRSDEAKAEYRARMNEELSQMAEQSPAAVLPITKAKGPDPVYDALRTMAARGILHTGPPSRTLEIGGIPRKMTLEQYREYLDRSSDIARRKLAALVTSPSWETMTDERKTQVVSGIVANARKAIRQKIKAQLAREFRGQQFRPQNSEKRS